MGNLVDLHCDTISALQNAGAGEGLYENSFSVDIKKMERSGISVQFFACFVDGKAYIDAGGNTDGSSDLKREQISSDAWDRAYNAVLDMTERIRREEGAKLGLAVSYGDILENLRKNRISAIATVEEGGVLNGKEERLEELYQKGIRLMTLTWNYENCLGYPNSRRPDVMCRGLKKSGFETVERMNGLGMLVDVSHLSDGGFWDCIRISRKPVVASHSNARVLCRHPRNLTDEMLKALAQKGGVSGLNFYPLFLRQDAAEVTVQDIARHAAHMIRVAGEDVAAIGTDFDGFESGITKQKYISHTGEMEQIWEAMKKEGITERQIDKIREKNAMRVIRDILIEKKD